MSQHESSKPRLGEAFFRKVLQNAGDITSVLAPDGRRIYISSGVTQMLGFTEEEALNLKVAESTHPDDQQRLLETFRRLLTTPGATERLRFRQRHKDGSYRTVDAFVHNACADPDVGGVVVNTRDVTEQVRLEAQFLQAQKLESVGRLAGGVAHDFNNLLTVILSCAELLQTQRPSPDSREYIEEIIAAADRARTLTRQLLAFAKKEVVRPTPLDLSAQVRASEKILRRLVGEDVEVVVECAPVWPVRCDAGQIDQVLFNLVVNARDATPSGGRITLSTRNVPGIAGAADEVSLVVRDTGSGIAPDHLPRIFEPFFTTKPAGKGTGLGLATVHGIVHQHGGRVSVDSSPGQGSVFEVRLPRCAQASEDATALRGVAHRPGRERVLVVEDDSAVRHLAVRSLTSAGYQVVAAADGDAALQLLREQAPFELIITDVVMPGQDGLKVAQFARTQRPGVRVLFTSGYPADRLSADGQLDREVDFLPKPFTPSGLLERVRAALDRRAAAEV